MLTEQEIIGSVDDSEIDGTLFEELVEEHLALHKAYHRKDYEKALLKAGKFVETLFQNLEYILDGKYSTNPSINNIKDALEQTPKEAYPDSIRLMIPRRGKVMYGLRSKRGGAHKTEVDPRYMDATAAASDSSWILSELIRIFSENEPESVESIVHHIVTESLPFVEEFEDGDLMLLIDPGSCKEEELLVLYHFYPARVTTKEMGQYLDHQKASNISTSLGNAQDEKLIHRNENGAKLTMKGRRYIEQNYGTEFDERGSLSSH